MACWKCTWSINSSIRAPASLCTHGHHVLCVCTEHLTQASSLCKLGRAVLAVPSSSRGRSPHLNRTPSPSCVSVCLLQAAMEGGLQPQMVRPQLYISSMRTELYREVLETNGITHILQVGRAGQTPVFPQPLPLQARVEEQARRPSHTTCLLCAAVAAQTHRSGLSCSPATRSTLSTCSCQLPTGRSRTSCRPSRQHSTSSMQAWTEVSRLARRDVHGFVT